MGNFDSAKWIKNYKLALVEEKKKDKDEEYKGHKPEPADDNIKKKGQAVHSKDLLHTTKVDGKKADKVDAKRGAENDLAIEKDKDGMDVYAGGLREAFTPGDMWSDDFDYVGMVKYGMELEIPEDLSQLVAPEYVQMLNDTFESFTDVNYHREAQDLGNAIDYIEDGIKNQDPSKKRMELERGQELLESFKAACAKTYKEFTRGAR